MPERPERRMTIKELRAVASVIGAAAGDAPSADAVQGLDLPDRDKEAVAREIDRARRLEVLDAAVVERVTAVLGDKLERAVAHAQVAQAAAAARAVDAVAELPAEGRSAKPPARLPERAS
jgi:hypothetical protein